MKAPKTILLLLLLCGQPASSEDSANLEVRQGPDSFDGSDFWIGLIRENLPPPESTQNWNRETAREFSVRIPTGSDSATLVFLKKNCEPVFVSLTSDLLQTGLALDFSCKESLLGRVTTTTGEPISGGTVKLDLSQILDFSPPDPDLSSWVIGEDGFFEIRGLLPGRYVVTVASPDFMPASREVVLIKSDQSQELNFQMDRATYVTGRIVDRYGTIMRGEFDTVVTPPESQTTPIKAEFDLDDNFRVGPFAEGVTVELTTHDVLGRRSHMLEVRPPTEDVLLRLHRWVTLIGTVLNNETGDPVDRFQLTSSGEGRGQQAYDVFAPDGRLKLHADDMSQLVEIAAPGFLLWSSSRYLRLEGRETYDLGTIELEPARTVRGRVTDSSTQLPIEGAELRRIHLQEGVLNRWIYGNVFARTDDDGEFELVGLPSVDGLLSVSVRGYQTKSVTVEDVESYLEIELDQRSGSIKGRLSGRVVSLDGEPLHPANVSIGFAGKRTAEDGSFTFEITGSYRISASAESGRSKVIKGTVENGEHVSDLELVISEIGRVHGTVQGLSEGETATVTVARRGGRVDPNGAFKMRGIPIGEHVARCTTSTGREISRTIEMDETLDLRLDFVFEGANSLTGRVSVAGNPAPSLEVQAIPDERDQAWAKTTTLGDGTFVIDGLTEGIYRVRVTSRGISRRVAVRGDTQIDIDLGSLELSGRIDAPGSVLGVHVYLTGYGTGGSFQQHTTVDASGFYSFTGIAKGNYEVTTHHDKYKETTRSVRISDSVHDFNVFLQPIKRDRTDRDLK